MQGILTLEDVSYFAKKKLILEKIILHVHENQFTLIQGKSGSGKTTLLNLMGGLEKPRGGKIRIRDLSLTTWKERLAARREYISFIFQSYGLMDNETVYNNFKLIFGKEINQDDMEKALQKVNLTANILKKKVFQLSGGEQQRIAIARTVLSNHPIILADEPTGNLDQENAKQIFGLFKSLQKEGKTIICVSHDAFTENYADKIYRLTKQGIECIK